ncbi:MAG: recombination-associated protein RdgC [Solimicrobium sp.]|jgi:recombination associated protein RdgC|nr:recombination-associated protein RdgC [Solimicrobium sp.]
MWFKNLQIYRLPRPWKFDLQELNAQLSTQSFQPCANSEMQSQGWIAPRENGELVHSVNRQLLLQLSTERKLLPNSVINQVSKARALEIEEQQGFKPGRKLLKEIKEQVGEELLPRAFSIQRMTSVWIDPIHGWLVIDASSPTRADEVLKLLLKCINQLPIESLRVNLSPLTAMTDWLAGSEAPAEFTIDQDTELRSNGESKATVRYVRHTLDPQEIASHIASGKQCTKLALTWADKVSFVLTENLAVKRLQALDVLTEKSESHHEDEKLDGDFALMCGELNLLLNDLVAALGGEIQSRNLVFSEAKADVAMA